MGMTAKPAGNMRIARMVASEEDVAVVAASANAKNGIRARKYVRPDLRLHFANSG